MLDEWVDKKVDETCEAVSAYLNLNKIRLARYALGWRFYLYGSVLKHKVVDAYHAYKKMKDGGGEDELADDGDEFVERMMLRSGDFLEHTAAFFRRKMQLLAVLDDAAKRIRFATTLFLFGMAALGALVVGGREMAFCALSICLMLLSTGLELGYEPICGRIRQRYLVSIFLRMVALSLPLADYFPRYLAYGVKSNIVLQSAMIAAISVHLALFCALILFNKRQPLMLRMLSGIFGVLPAVTAAAAIALAAAGFAQGERVTGILRAAGICCAFLGDRLIAVSTLGGIRLKYESIWEWLLVCGGLTLMLAGAWTLS